MKVLALYNQKFFTKFRKRLPLVSDTFCSALLFDGKNTKLSFGKFFVCIRTLFGIPYDERGPFFSTYLSGCFVIFVLGSPFFSFVNALGSLVILNAVGIFNRNEKVGVYDGNVPMCPR